jgi:hypothetical protein
VSFSYVHTCHLLVYLCVVPRFVYISFLPFVHTSFPSVSTCHFSFSQHAFVLLAHVPIYYPFFSGVSISNRSTCQFLILYTFQFFSFAHVPLPDYIVHVSVSYMSTFIHNIFIKHHQMMQVCTFQRLKLLQPGESYLPRGVLPS